MNAKNYQLELNNHILDCELLDKKVNRVLKITMAFIISGLAFVAVAVQTIL